MEAWNRVVMHNKRRTPEELERDLKRREELRAIRAELRAARAAARALRAPATPSRDRHG
jgi:hypothetical protein